MHTRTIGTHTVPGARLYYEVRGAGPAILIIASGNGDADPYRPIAEALADRYTVITYDRRGYSRSCLDGPVDDEARLFSEADDARSLIEHLAAPPAHVFGSSSGAIVAIALLQRHPSQVRTLIAHEPPLASVLPDSAEWLRFYADLYDTYRSAGIETSRAMFRTRMGMVATRPPKSTELPPAQLAAMLARLRINEVFWYEHEVRTYPGFLPDLALLKSLSERLILAGGDTSRADFPYRPNQVLAEQIGTGMVHFPGGHVGYVTHPVEFAKMFASVIAERDG